MRFELSNLTLYLLLLVRFVAMISFNPLFSRRNAPAQVRVGLAFFMTLLLAPTLDGAAFEGMNGFTFAACIIKELFTGYLLGFVFQIFFMMLYFAGDILDTTFGFSMAKVMDPATRIQTAFTSNILGMLFLMYIFATDSHLVMIHLFATSIDIFPLGGALISADTAQYLIEMFVQVTGLVIRLSLPFVAMEFVLEACLGILMKVVPQITIFVINFQLKITLALIMLLLFTPIISAFIDNYIVILLDAMQDTMMRFGGYVGGVG